MINTHQLELSLSRTYVHGAKGVRAIEVLLYVRNVLDCFNFRTFCIHSLSASDVFFLFSAMCLSFSY